MDDYSYDLGTHTCAITTVSDKAQKWFDRGLIWTFSYNHQEAVACFQKALSHDPECAMAHWGVAYAGGPNYNMPWERFDDAGRADALAASYQASQTALGLADGCSPAEKALIAALPARYPQAELDDDMHAWNHAFADAMRAAGGRAGTRKRAILA